MSKLKMPLRILLGLIYVVFGLNFFLNFIPTPPPPPEKLMNFVMALVNTGYFMFMVKGIEIAFGAMLLAGLYVPLSLVILAPITLNIFFVHFFLDGMGFGLVMALVMVIIHVLLGLINIDAYRSMLKK